MTCWQLPGAVRRELTLWSQSADHFLKKVEAYRPKIRSHSLA
jgi:hypothetical protein